MVSPALQVIFGARTVHSWNDGLDVDEVGDGQDGFSGARVSQFANASSLGASPMGARVTAQLGHDERYYNTQSAQPRRSGRNRMGLGAFFGGGDDDD